VFDYIGILYLTQYLLLSLQLFFKSNAYGLVSLFVSSLF